MKDIVAWLTMPIGPKETMRAEVMVCAACLGLALVWLAMKVGQSTF